MLNGGGQLNAIDDFAADGIERDEHTLAGRLKDVRRNQNRQDYVRITLIDRRVLSIAHLVFRRKNALRREGIVSGGSLDEQWHVPPIYARQRLQVRSDPQLPHDRALATVQTVQLKIGSLCCIVNSSKWVYLSVECCDDDHLVEIKVVSFEGFLIVCRLALSSVGIAVAQGIEPVGQGSPSVAQKAGSRQNFVARLQQRATHLRYLRAQTTRQHSNYRI